MRHQQLFRQFLACNIMSMFPSFRNFLLSFFTLIVVCFISTKWISYLFKNKKNLPPSPRKLPIIGNFHQLSSSPNRSLQALSRKHGPIMLLHFGSVPTLVASSAEVAREIMKTQDLSFASRPSLTIPSIIMYGCKGIAFSPYGEYWRKLKSIVIVNLLSNTQVKLYRKVREEETKLIIDILEESCGSWVNMTELLGLHTVNIASRVALGRKYDGLKLQNLMKKLVDTFTSLNIGTYITWLSWVDRLTGLDSRARQIGEEFDEFLENVIEEHVKKEREVKDASDVNRDFVDLLLDIQKDNATDFILHRDNLKAIILDMFAAGTDTTSTTLEWAVSELVKHTRVMRKLQQEITIIAQGRSIIVEEDLEKMIYLKSVIKETLRLHPPVPLLLPHLSIKDVKLMGYDIAAGTQVIINAWAIGRDPNLWEEPERFWPERFLTNTIDYKGLHFELIPFGAGRRGCPGIQFGTAIAELALANIVHKFNLELPHGIKNEDLDMSEVCGITLYKKSSLIVIPSTRM